MSHPIELQVVYSSVGGTGNVVSGASLVLLWEDSETMPIVSWDNATGQFTISMVGRAPILMQIFQRSIFK